MYAVAQTEVNTPAPDTSVPLHTPASADTLVVSSPDEVRVITSGDTMTVNIIGKKDEPNYYYNKKVIVNDDAEEVTTTSRNVGSGLGWDFSLIEGSTRTPQIEIAFRASLYAGFSVLMGKPSDMKSKFFKQAEAGIDITEFGFYPRSDKWWLTLNWGILLNRYNLSDNMMSRTDDGVGLMPYPDGSRDQSSYFSMLSNNLTLMWYYRLSKHTNLGLGVGLINRVADNCHYKTKYTLSDDTSVTDMGELPIRSNMLSLTAQYMLDNLLGVYVRYTPMSPFKKDKGLDFQQLTFGLKVRF